MSWRSTFGEERPVHARADDQHGSDERERQRHERERCEQRATLGSTEPARDDGRERERERDDREKRGAIERELAERAHAEPDEDDDEPRRHDRGDAEQVRSARPRLPAVHL